MRRDDFCRWAERGEHIAHIVNRSAIAARSVDEQIDSINATIAAYNALPPEQRRPCCG
jgi:hypothetical protein